MEKIFVQIASYRDPECQWTLKDMFEKAQHPERVFAGICWVAEPAEDHACFSVPAPMPSHISTIMFAPHEEKGINWARMQAQSLWNGEEYVLQIHSHMRFVEGWDSLLIDQLRKCPSPRPVLSTSPPGYIPPHTFPYREDTKASFATVYTVNPDEPVMLGIAGKLVHTDTPIPAQMRSPFAIGSFLFARSELMKDVPFDPHLYYYNSELAYSARLWTHGYDIFQPDRYVVFHWYARDVLVPRPYREINQPQHTISKMRVRHLLHLEPAPLSEALHELDRYGLGDTRRMEDFWPFAGFDMRSTAIDDFARKGQFDAAFEEVTKKAAAVSRQKKPTIFVQIASYRDTECQWTVKDLFDKAAFADRVHIGICWQYDPEEDQDCFKVNARPQQVRISPFHWKESQGVCWARYQAQRLYENEDYVLMIDSHMRFVFGWDELLIKELEKCAYPKAVLSNHPASYTPPHELEVKVTPTALCVLPFTEDGDIRVAGGFMRKKPPKPLQGAFIAAGFVFARGDIVREVPYDPYLYFNQEEISLSARLFTHGWKVFHPSIVTAYHCYNTGDSATKKRPLHWNDNRDWAKLQDKAKKRFNHLLDHSVSDDPEVTRDLMIYGLGDAFTLEQFETFSGIDFKKRTTSDVAIHYGFTNELHSYMRPDAPSIKPAGAMAGGAPVHSFPNPAMTVDLPYNIMQLANGGQRVLNVDYGAPKDVLIIYDYIEKEICDALARYADAQSFTELGVVDFQNSDTQKIAIAKDAGRVTTHVEIDGVAAEVLSVFNDIYCNRMAPFYETNFEWYERPQILRYPAGGKYNQHADADHWLADKNEWVRVQDRDYSVLLYLNDEYEGGELQFVNQEFTIKPKPGMLVAFPSDHKFLHAALPTTSGLRYVIVSWAAILGSRRVRPQPPYASVFVRQKRKKQA